MDASLWADIIGIAISSISGVVVAVITTNNRIKKDRESERIEQALRDQKQDMKFEQIEKKLDEHNGYAQKFGEVHDAIVAQANDIKWIKEALHGKK